MKVQQIARRQKSEETPAAIMRILKLRGEMTVAEFCRSLKLTHTAVRRHLARLVKDDLLAVHAHPMEKGRPVNKYTLTGNAAKYFPSGYERMLADVLDTVFESGGHKAVMDLLRTNTQRTMSSLAPQFQHIGLQERVALLAEYFSENGYMTGWKKLADGNFFIYHQNCAIFTVAVKYRQCCILEPRLMEALLQSRVVRQQYILKGKPICGYLVESAVH